MILIRHCGAPSTLRGWSHWTELAGSSPSAGPDDAEYSARIACLSFDRGWATS
jgi:hypothetical protein